MRKPLNDLPYNQRLESTGFQVRGGSAAPVLRWTSMTETTEQRIKQLKADFPDGGNASNKALQPPAGWRDTQRFGPFHAATNGLIVGAIPM